MEAPVTRTSAAVLALGSLLLATAAPAGAATPAPNPAAAPDPGGPAVQEPVRVVATLPVYAAIVESIGGDAVSVTSIADPGEDAHFVRPKPSFALALRRADLFITTGLDLELWVPALLDKANNPDVLEGGQGYVTAYTGIRLLEVPESADRSRGDIHIYGNPHLHTDPARTVQVARNITAGLTSVAPERRARWEEGFQAFRTETFRSLVGPEIVELLGVDAVEQLALSGNLWPFLSEREYEGAPLMDRLGGWLAEARPIRGEEIICYHRDWAYFEERFGVRCTAYVESKPGIPPTPRHVARLIDLMREQEIGAVLAPSYYSRDRVEQVARRGGARPVWVPFYPGGATGIEDYEALVDRWIDELVAAVGGGGS